MMPVVMVAALLGACWMPPVDAAVIDPYRQPACQWCPGNRGIKYGTDPGVPVRAVGSGTVTFAGVVVDIGYVVVQHADGRRVTYGGVQDWALRAGDTVTRHMVIARTAGTFHFGLRVGDEYRDPGPHLGVLVGLPRLIPTDGATPRPGPPPRLRCPTGRSG